MQNNETTTINSDLANYPVAKYKYGAIWTDEDKPCAVAIINGRLAISDEKRNGDWYWTTVMDAGKVLVNEVFTGKLYTSLIEILGDKDDARLSIKNNLIKITQGNKTRVQIGYDGNKYVFDMFDKGGNNTLHMDENGNLTMTGEFATGREGQARVVINKNGIQSFSENGEKNGVFVNPNLVGANESNFEVFVDGRSTFSVRRAAAGMNIYGLDGGHILGQSGTGTNGFGTWVFQGTLKYGQNEVATKADIEKLQRQIDALKGGGE